MRKGFASFRFDDFLPACTPFLASCSCDPFTHSSVRNCQRRLALSFLSFFFDWSKTRSIEFYLEKCRRDQFAAIQRCRMTIGSKYLVPVLWKYLYLLTYIYIYYICIFFVRETWKDNEFITLLYIHYIYLFVSTKLKKCFLTWVKVEVHLSLEVRNLLFTTKILHSVANKDGSRAK